MGSAISPRFVLAGPTAAGIATILASRGWRALAVESDPTLVHHEDLERSDVLVIACTERTLLTPGLQDTVSRIALGVPRVAVIQDGGPDVAAHVARLGWQGCVGSDESAAAICEVIASAADGELSFPSSATSALVRALARIAPMQVASSEALTPRQRQIVALIAQGATDAEVATLLRISRSTARKHVLNARRRLHARTRSQLVAASRDTTTTPLGRAG